MKYVWIVGSAAAGFAIGIIVAAFAAISVGFGGERRPCEAPCDGGAMAAGAIFTVFAPVLATFFAIVFGIIGWRVHKRMSKAPLP